MFPLTLLEWKVSVHETGRVKHGWCQYNTVSVGKSTSCRGCTQGGGRIGPCPTPTHKLTTQLTPHPNSVERLFVLLACLEDLAPPPPLRKSGVRPCRVFSMDIHSRICLVTELIEVGLHNVRGMVLFISKVNPPRLIIHNASGHPTSVMLICKAKYKNRHLDTCPIPYIIYPLYIYSYGGVVWR